jgi:citrate lyase subunit beta / citryl-CoA lyase
MTTHSWRSILFAPANRTDFVPKLIASTADLIVIDLEDSVAPTEKVAARSLARSTCIALRQAGSPGIGLRVNAIKSQWFEHDVMDALAPNLDAIFLPKVERVAEISQAVAALDAAGCSHIGIVAGIETVRGVYDVLRLTAHERTVACYFGAEDYIADLGGVRRTDNFEVQYARAQIGIACRMSGAAALDMAVTAFTNVDRFRIEAQEARALGFAGKLCIHPSQVPAANAEFIPSCDEVARARRLLAHYDVAVAEGRGAIVVDGELVDAPLAALARRVLGQRSD